MHPDTPRATRGAAVAPDLRSVAGVRTVRPAEQPQTAARQAIDTARTARRTAVQNEPKPSKPRRTAPPGVVLPRHGWAGFRYKVNCLFGRPDRVPALGPRDHEELLDRKIRFLAENLQITVCFANTIGGASKTTTALYTGSIIASLSDKTICAMPATSSTETSTTALKAGVSTLTVSELNAKIRRGEVDTYKKLSAEVPRSKFGLFVISEDDDEGTSTGDFGVKEFIENFETVDSKVDSILLDLGNDTVKSDSVVYEAARRSDVIVYTTTVDKPETLVKLVNVISKHMSFLTDEEALQSGHGRTAAQIPLREKAASAIVVVSKLEGNAKAEDYRKFTMRRNGKASTSIGFTGSIMGIPLDRYMRPPKVSKATADDIDRMIVADLTKIGRATRIAYKELVVRIYEQAAANRYLQIDYGILGNPSRMKR